MSGLRVAGTRIGSQAIALSFSNTVLALAKSSLSAAEYAGDIAGSRSTDVSHS